MKKNKYILYSREGYCYPSEIKNGCTEENPCEFIKQFNTKQEAVDELQKYHSNIFYNYKQNKKVNVIEYLISEEYKEGGMIKINTIYAEWN